MKKPKIIIRKAKKEDVPAINKLGNGLIGYHKKIETNDDVFYNQRKKNSNILWKKFVEKNIRSKKGLVLIAYDNKKLAAYCVSFIKKNIPIFKIKEYGYISDLYVEKNYRGKGLGKKLINESKKFFKKNKIKFMELGVAHNNYHSIKFYQKYGFKEYHKQMRMKI